MSFFHFVLISVWFTLLITSFKGICKRITCNLIFTLSFQKLDWIFCILAYSLMLISFSIIQLENPLYFSQFLFPQAIFLPLSPKLFYPTPRIAETCFWTIEISLQSQYCFINWHLKTFRILFLSCWFWFLLYYLFC